MKDLYTRLGLRGAGHTAAEIRRALETQRSNPDDAREASAILLDPHRRPAYDRTWRTLTTIGALRSKLDLAYEAYWGPDYADFTPRQQPEAKPRKARLRMTRAGWALAFLAFLSYFTFNTIHLHKATSSPADKTQDRESHP